jgi:hypothetical protein
VGAAYKLGEGRPWFGCRGHVRHFCQSHWSSLNDRGARPTRSERASPVGKPHRLQHHRTKSGKGHAPPPRRLSRHSIRSALYIALPCLFHSFCTRGTGRQTQHPSQDRDWHMAHGIRPWEGRQGRRPAEEPQSVPRAGAADLIPVGIGVLHLVPVLRPDSARQTEVSGAPGRLTSCGHRDHYHDTYTGGRLPPPPRSRSASLSYIHTSRR